MTLVPIRTRLRYTQRLLAASRETVRERSPKQFEAPVHDRTIFITVISTKLILTMLPGSALGTAKKPGTGRSCPYQPCATGRRKVVFKTFEGWFRHLQRTHPSVHDRSEQEKLHKQARQKVLGGMRYLTAAAMREAGMEDSTKLESGQRAMDRTTEIETRRIRMHLESHQFSKRLQTKTTNLATSEMLAEYKDDDLEMEEAGQEEGSPEIEGDKSDTDEYQIDTRKQVFPCYSRQPGKTYGHCKDENAVFPVERNIFFPFDNAWDFKVGAWLTRGKLTTSHIISGFNDGIIQRVNGKYQTSLTSAKTLNDKLDQLEPDFGEGSWKCGKAFYWADGEHATQVYHYRNPLLIVKHLFKQPAYEPYLAYKPVITANSKGERIYSEMNSGKWWEEQQVGNTSIAQEQATNEQ